MPAILVVDDDEDSHNLMKAFLRGSGYMLFYAPDGESGVKAASEHIPDLILMDLGLPGIDGWEAARQIRLNNETAHIPIVALTAHALLEDVTRAIQIGFDAYETKPLSQRRLLGKIDALVNTKLR